MSRWASYLLSLVVELREVDLLRNIKELEKHSVTSLILEQGTGMLSTKTSESKEPCIVPTSGYR